MSALKPSLAYDAPSHDCGRRGPITAVTKIGVEGKERDFIASVRTALDVSIIFGVQRAHHLLTIAKRSLNAGSVVGPPRVIAAPVGHRRPLARIFHV